MYSSVAIPLRMIEVFTDPKTVTATCIRIAILEHLSKCGRFYKYKKAKTFTLYEGITVKTILQ